MSARGKLFADLKTAAATAEMSARVVELKKEEGVALTLTPSIQLRLYASAIYPAAPPVAQFVDAGFTAFVPVSWSGDGAPHQKLSNFLKKHIAGPAPLRLMWGFDAASPMTSDPNVGAAARMAPVVTGAPTVPMLMESVSERVDGATSAALRDATVVIIGLGSAGSYLAEQLARMGVGKIIGFDNETVETHNLTRTAYELADVGVTKTAALSRRLAAINPHTDLQMFNADVKAVPGDTLRTAFDEASLIIAATDEIDAQNLINRCAHHAKRAALFVGLYRRADGGEIVMTLPGVTPCYSCCTGSLRDQAQAGGIAPERSEGDYGRLRGEIALGADIHHVMSAALKISVSLLCLTRPDASDGARLVMGAIERGLSMVTLGMTQDYWFYPVVFEPIKGSQHAFQSVWMRTESWPDCQTCGPQADSMDPFSSRGTPLNAALRDRVLRQIQS